MTQLGAKFTPPKLGGNEVEGVSIPFSPRRSQQKKKAELLPTLLLGGRGLSMFHLHGVVLERHSGKDEYAHLPSPYAKSPWEDTFLKKMIK